MTTDTTEKGLESLLVTAMPGRVWPEPHDTGGLRRATRDVRRHRLAERPA